MLYEAGNDPGRVVLAARLPVIVLALSFGLVVFAFARDVVGTGGGLVAVALYAFSPDVVAHGSLATLDVPAAGFALTSAWLVWRARCRALPYLPLAGLALGAAVATKMSALAVVPVLVVLVVLSGWRARVGRWWVLGAAVAMLLPAGVLLVAAMTGDRDLGVRYAVFLAVAAAGVVVVRWRWVSGAAVVLVVFVGVSSWRAFPYYLPYSNEAFGGPAGTRLHLHDSNVDWGQDLGRLAERLARCHPGERVWLVYKGSGVPAHHGIRADDPLAVPPERVRGLLVVSDSAAARADGRLRVLLERSTPVDDVGHSITIYRRS